MDPASIRNIKRDLRRDMRARLASVTPEERAQHSDAACSVAGASSPFARATTVLLYDALPDEIDPKPLLRAALASAKRVCLPRVDWDAGTMAAIQITSPDFPAEIRRHDVREPLPGTTIPPEELDLILVPGLAFDPDGRRLGRGKGFYDRFLATTPPHTHRLALCFAFQLIDAVPADSHDARVHAVATESGLTTC